MADKDEKDVTEIKPADEKVVEEVKDKVVEAIVEVSGVKEVELVVREVADAVTTAVSEGAKEVTDKLGLKLISESSLSEDQKKLASQIYDTLKLSTLGVISDPNLNNAIKITRTIGQIVRQLETTKVDGKQLTGADKKAVAIQLGRILIKEVTPDDKGEAEILVMYDLVAESTLEAMIEVSKVVNVAVHKMALKCCPGLLSIFKMRKGKACATK